jgi:hypothetical protein
LRNVQSAPDFVLTRIGNLSAGFYVRTGHPLLATAQQQPADLMPFGLASVRVPEALLLLLAPLMGMEKGTLLPLALECDDLNLLKLIAMGTDTVCALTDAGTLTEVAAGKLVRLNVAGLPPMFSDMGIVSLKGRSYSLMARYAADYLMALATEQSDIR